jgi:hypothetical protein
MTFGQRDPARLFFGPTPEAAGVRLLPSQEA